MDKGKNINKSQLKGIFFLLFIVFLSLPILSKEPSTVCDIDMAKEICDSTPLDQTEGVWAYPDDNVVVLILRDDDSSGISQLPVYKITVLESTDCRLSPGETLGRLYSTAQAGTYKIELFTEKNNELLLKPKSCVATLSKENDTLIIKKEKSKLKLRLNLSLNRLLPGFWKIVSSGISTALSSESSLPIGMVKIYPSYDGNNSSKRKIRYL